MLRHDIMWTVGGCLCFLPAKLPRSMCCCTGGGDLLIPVLAKQSKVSPLPHQCAAVSLLGSSWGRQSLEVKCSGMQQWLCVWCVLETPWGVSCSDRDFCSTKTIRENKCVWPIIDLQYFFLVLALLISNGQLNFYLSLPRVCIDPMQLTHSIILFF